MKILLFGGSGQLGYEIRMRTRSLNFDLVSPVTSEVSIVDRDQVFFLSEKIAPELIINAAAYTAVDKAEEERELAFKVNCDGAANVAAAAANVGARMIQLSTDYVFGTGFSEPIPETAVASPLNVYGESKLAGEQAVCEKLGQAALVVRTASLHGQKGENIVNTFVRLFSDRDLVRVVNDQFMSPTWAGWLAEVILDLSRIDCHGLVHACSGARVSWFEFASAILELVQAKLPETREVRLEPVLASEFPRPAQRPPYSVMDTAKLTTLLGRKPLNWKEGLRAHLRELDYVAA